MDVGDTKLTDPGLNTMNQNETRTGFRQMVDIGFLVI